MASLTQPEWKILKDDRRQHNFLICMSEQQRDRKEGKTENEAMRKKKKKSFRVNSFSPQKNKRREIKTKHLVSYTKRRS